MKLPEEMYFGDKVGKSTDDIVDLFAKHFESFYVPEDTDWNFEQSYVPTGDAKENNVSLFDIEAAVESLDCRSGSGPDEIKPSVIKNSSSAMPWPIWLLFQKSFDNTNNQNDVMCCV